MREPMMHKSFVELLTAIATDSKALADFQTDPARTMAGFGLNDCDMRELIEAVGKQTSTSGHVVASSTVAIPVTHSAG